MISINSGKYDPCPEGEFNAVCVDVVDLGDVTSVYKGKEKTQRKILITWQVDKLDEKGLPFLVFKRYTASLNEKSALFADLKRWFRGSEFGKMLAAVKKDVEVLLGKGCRLDIIHNEKDGNTYANIDGIKPVPTGQTAPAVHPAFVRKQDREEGEGPFGKRDDNESDPEDKGSDEDVPF